MAPARDLFLVRSRSHCRYRPAAQLALSVRPSGEMRRDQRFEAMLKMAHSLARHGHRLPMIEALLRANGFTEATVFLNQPHIHNELVDMADRVRRGEQAAKGTESLAAP